MKTGQKIIPILIIIIIAMSLCSCATIVDGITQRVKIESSPDGARVCMNGSLLAQPTPCEIKLDKRVSAGPMNKDHECVYVFTKEGYIDKVVRDAARDHYDVYYYLNVLFFWGFFVDSYSGANIAYSDNISATLEPDYGYIAPSLGQLPENEGIVYGEIKFSLGGKPLHAFGNSADAALGSCQALNVSGGNITDAEWKFTLKGKDNGRFYMKLPQGTYAFTRLYMPFMNTYFSPGDSVCPEQGMRVSGIDSARTLKFDVLPQKATYIGTLMIDLSYRYDIEDLHYVGFLDSHNVRRSDKYPDTDEKQLLIYTPGQLESVRINTKDFELVNETIERDTLCLSYQKKEGGFYRYVYGTAAFSLSSHWAVINEDAKNNQIFHAKFPRIPAGTGSRMARMELISK